MRAIYVESLIRGPLEELWRLTQEPGLHQRWDLRFTSIEYLPRPDASRPQQFLYSTRIGFGLRIRGRGESVGGSSGADGERTSALRFWSDDGKSLIRKGSGYWQYVPTPDAFQTAVLDLIHYAQELADRKRREPGDDLISALLLPDGQMPLTDEEYEGLVLLLLGAGNETTRSAIAQGLLAFAEYPDQWAILRDDPDGTLDTAIEEVIRWASPVNYMARTATRDIELHDQLIRAGDKVVLLYSSANRDETVFDEPDRFDVRRTPNHHLGFGFGPHFCLGATLARIELRAIFEVLIPRVSRFELAGPVVRARSSFLNAIKELPLRVA